MVDPTVGYDSEFEIETQIAEGRERDVNSARDWVRRQFYGETIIDIRNLDFFYSKNRVLRDVTLGIPRDGVTAIMGPSGCGKSTLLRTLNRMYEVVPGARAAGEVIFEGENLLRTDPVVLRHKIGMVFQRPNPFPKSIFDNIAYGPRIHGLRNRRQLATIVEDALRRAALWDQVKDRLKDSAFSLSGGQQQRLCIARALAVSPQILLMDEPCSALDPKASDRIEHTARELAEELTVIIVTHNLQQAGRVSDNVAVLLAGGELAEFGPTRSVFEDPEDERVADYLQGRFG
jgi:phosphate transport system ATP-binding protein